MVKNTLNPKILKIGLTVKTGGHFRIFSRPFKGRAGGWNLEGLSSGKRKDTLVRGREGGEHGEPPRIP